MRQQDVCIISFKGRDVAMVSLEPFENTKWNEREFHEVGSVAAPHYVRYFNNAPTECFCDMYGLGDSIELAVAELYKMHEEESARRAFMVCA
jgi:hypothetical protein